MKVTDEMVKSALAAAREAMKPHYVIDVRQHPHPIDMQGMRAALESLPSAVTRGGAIGECEECGHKIVTPLTPLPVAWRHRTKVGNEWGSWRHQESEPRGPADDSFQYEPLFSSPSIASTVARTDDLPQPWADDVALRGPNAPKNTGMLKHLIEYLLTVYKRFGNTTVTEGISLQWGATALHKRNEEKEEIERLRGDLEKALANHTADLSSPSSSTAASTEITAPAASGNFKDERDVEIARLRAFVEQFKTAYPNIRQLQDGFATDESWSEWDQSVREETMRLGAIAFNEPSISPPSATKATGE